ncbi:MAG: tyrosinase family protein [Acidobacteriota bacterium]
MSNFSRRSFLASMAAAPLIPFSEWFEKYAQAAPPLIRYNATSINGQAMLKKYANGVKTMMATPSKDPKSWVFQWYSHWIQGPQVVQPTKNNTINSIYGAAASPWKTLAQAMWDECQAHNGQNENYFLPWHRMFVYFFERIVRSVTDPTFTLPYWNYSVAGPAHGVIPKQFRLQNDPVFGPLFVAKRNKPPGHPDVNAGQPIDQGQPDSPLSTVALSECTYSPVGPKQGFCQRLDFGLHGNVHVLTGGTQNMGAVPWAAGDPIFWMHHCNIDRLWASWNKAGRPNPSDLPFLSKQFTFADENGNKVSATIKDFLKIAPLNYTYDAFERVPVCPIVVQGAQGPVNHFQKSGIELSSGAVKVTFDSAQSTRGSFADRVRRIKAGRHLYVVIKNLKADLDPGVLYHVYLELPSTTSPKRGGANFVGTIHFFDAVGHDHSSASSDDPEKFFSFDVTALAKRLLAAKKLGETPSLTIAPAGEPASDAKPVVGDISFVEG